MSHRTEVRLLELPLVESLDTAHGTSGGTHRPLVVVGLTAGDVTGWGECAALGAAGYTAETARSAFELLSVGVVLDSALEFEGEFHSSGKPLKTHMTNHPPHLRLNTPRPALPGDG